MDIKFIEDLLKSMELFSDMDADYLKWVAGCGINEQYKDQELLFERGDPADHFYIIRVGQVAMELKNPAGKPVTIVTIGKNDIVGWSWLVPPYRCYFSARAIGPTRVIKMDARCLRQKCEEDNVLGYDLMKRFAGIMIRRLNVSNAQFNEKESAS